MCISCFHFIRWSISQVVQHTNLIATIAFGVTAGDYDHAPIGDVNWDNYHQAESDWYFPGLQEKVGVNQWLHAEPVSKEAQTVIRSNRDVVYSIMVVDVSDGATFNCGTGEAYDFRVSEGWAGILRLYECSDIVDLAT